ncbi:hypothetical protein QAD02_024269 [Eretmocerus hayati]|uniref:Uncharacterized protein n=1 Tax=Eretmocerus hayati TaxID=131215 RepID=A0ACC2Q0S6_9HYME|nr:hypothetical protein QAD02_024269 [Eretmocerus hayati]
MSNRLYRSDKPIGPVSQDVEKKLSLDSRYCKEDIYRMGIGAGYCEGNLNFATASEDDEAYSSKKKVSRSEQCNVEQIVHHWCTELGAKDDGTPEQLVNRYCNHVSSKDSTSHSCSCVCRCEIRRST